MTCWWGLKSLGNVIARRPVVDTGFWLRLQLGLLIESSTGYKQVTAVGPDSMGRDRASLLSMGAVSMNLQTYCKIITISSLTQLLQ